MEFCKKLKTLRLEKGLTQKQVSIQLEVTDSCYRNYELGIREPSLDVLKKICQVFDVSADYLLGLVDFY